jgi:List-Bact-rpt repeat protein
MRWAVAGGARTHARSSGNALIAMMAFASVVLGATGVDAASLLASWNAPTTNVDGTPLKDLGSYRVYLATTSPACPSPSFQTVASPTAAPTAGDTVSTRLTGLTVGATYFVRITAVDTAGLESACTSVASGVAQAGFSVTPTGTTSFGSITFGSTLDKTFAVQNTSAVSISGGATAASPFTITSGGSFSLAPGATQVVTVRFAPGSAGSFAGNVTFTAGGDTLSRGVSGSATAPTASATLTVTKNGTGTGTVTSAPVGIACGTDCTETVTAGAQFTLTPSADSGSGFAGWSGACTGTGTCTVTVNANMSVTATFNALPTSAPVPVITSLSPASTMAGSGPLTLTVNGSGFVASSVVLWNGAARTTRLVSASQLQADIAASDDATAASVPVRVSTPSPGGGTSGALTFTISPSSPAPAPNEIIVDNADPGVQDTASGRTFSGTWCLASATTKYGPNSLYACGRGLNTYRWTPRISVAGTYDVYVWVTPSKAFSNSVPFVVAHAAGTTMRTIDERGGTGGWILHGRYPLNAGTANYVEVRYDRQQWRWWWSGGTAGADAVRLVPVVSAQSVPLSTPGPVEGPAFEAMTSSAAVNESGDGHFGSVVISGVGSARGPALGLLRFAYAAALDTRTSRTRIVTDR